MNRWEIKIKMKNGIDKQLISKKEQLKYICYTAYLPNPAPKL